MSGPRALVGTAASLAAVIALVAIAGLAWYEPTRTGTLKYALLQGNDQDRRLTPAEIDAGYLTRKHLALARRLHGRYDVIVFPESSLETDPQADPAFRAELAALGRKHHSAIVANVIDEQHRAKTYNANRVYGPSGRLIGTYAKQHLVPFGEYVPFRNELGFIGELQQIPTDFDPGHGSKVFRIAGKPVGTVICFESAFTPLMRASVEKGAQAIIVTTNNRSYRRSPNSAQHLALEPDERGRGGPAGAPRVDLGDHRRHRRRRQREPHHPPVPERGGHRTDHHGARRDPVRPVRRLGRVGVPDRARRSCGRGGRPP